MFLDAQASLEPTPVSWLVGRFVCQSHFHISTWCLWTVIKRPWTTEHNLFSEHYDQQVSDLDLQSVFFQNVFLVSVVLYVYPALCVIRIF